MKSILVQLIHLSFIYINIYIYISINYCQIKIFDNRISVFSFYLIYDLMGVGG